MNTELSNLFLKMLTLRVRNFAGFLNKFNRYFYNYCDMSHDQSAHTFPFNPFIYSSKCAYPVQTNDVGEMCSERGMVMLETDL